MKVLHVVTGLGTGGAETQLRLLLQHTRHQADVVTLHNPGAVADQLRGDGVRVRDLGMRSNRDLAALAGLVRLIRADRYDVVHTHLYRACLYGRLAARLAGRPRIVATEHSLFQGQIEGRVATRGIRALYRGTERLGDATIAVSRAVRNELRTWGVPDRRLVHIPNGIDVGSLAFDAGRRSRLRADLGIGPDVTVLGAVGRLHVNKRFDDLIDAAAPLLGERRVLLLVGDGAHRADLVRRAADRGVADHVRFAGELPAPQVLSAMDLLVSPSSLETFGLAVVEALANGLPVVYRRSPALEEMDTATLPAVRVGESTEELRRALAEHGPRTASHHPVPSALAELDVVRVAAAVDDLYERLDDHRRVPVAG